MKGKVLIVYGGKSVEHDISVITAMQTMKFLPKEYEFLPVYIDRVGKWWIGDNLRDIKIYSNFAKMSKKSHQVTLVFGQNALFEIKKNKLFKVCDIFSVLNCCHGNVGEDGALQGALKCCGVATTSSGVTSSALCMDKSFMKDIFQANDIPSPTYVYFDRCAYERNAEKIVKEAESKIKYPMIVKPANLGSSIGISVCKTRKELTEALNLAFKFDSKILIEKLVENLKEFNCACFKFVRDYFSSAVNEVKNKKEIYTFEDKYLAREGKNQEVRNGIAKKVQTLTELVYKRFDCKGVVRVDFLFDEKNDKLYVNEINSIPGSLAFYLFKDVPFKDLIGALVKQSVVDYSNENALIKTFDSDALKLFEKVSISLKK